MALEVLVEQARLKLEEEKTKTSRRKARLGTHAPHTLNGIAQQQHSTRSPRTQEKAQGYKIYTPF